MINDLLKALSESWGPDTCQAPDGFESANPSKGQCCVSTLVLQYYLGGELIRGKTNKGTVHYWLRIGTCWIDPTREQFGENEYIIEYDDDPEKELWWFRDTEEKFTLLMKRVNEWMRARQL